MNNPQLETKLQPLVGQRQKGESDSAVITCNDWLRMGAGRSIVALIKNYQELSNFQPNYEPPTLSGKTAATWSSRYNWSDRARIYDVAHEELKNAERDNVYGYGLALDFERVKELIRLASFLKSQIYERGQGGDFHNVWLPDVKQIGSGDFAERVDIERFNSALISEYRAALDDIAKEVGGRKQKIEHSGDAKKPIIIKTGQDMNAL